MKRLLILFALLLTAASFPPDANIPDVSTAAVPNDGFDDWATFEATKLASFGRIMYVPDGVWDLGAPLEGKNVNGKWVANWVIYCQSRNAVLRIMPNSPAFQNAAAPKGLLVFGSTDGNAPSSIPSGGGDEGFRNSVYNCTIDRGETNPGATGIDLLCNNRGGVFNVRVIGGGRNAISAERAYPGPCEIRDSDLEGGAYGLRMTQVQHGLTLRNVRMFGQTVLGIDASANLIHAENLHIEMAGAVPAIRMTSPGAQLTLVRGTFGGGASTKSAIELGADTRALIVDSSAAGSSYDSLIKDGTVTLPGLEQAHWVSHETIPPGVTTLGLPELPPPAVFESADFADDWASPTHHGCLPGDTLDDQACAQMAADSGKPVLYFPSVAPPLIPRWRFSGQLHIPCSVKRIVGLESILVAHTGRPAGLDLFVFDDPACSWSDVTTVEGLWSQAAIAGGAQFAHHDARTLYIRDLQAPSTTRGVYQAPGAGKLFIEDVAMRSVEINGDAWAWQLDLEGLAAGQTSYVAAPGRLRVLGVKTEGLAMGGEPSLDVLPGAQVELLGGLYMPCVGLGGAPPQLGFRVVDADFSANWTNWCSASFAAAIWQTQVLTTQDGNVSYVTGTELPAFQPGVGWKVMNTLYSTRRATTCEAP